MFSKEDFQIDSFSEFFSFLLILPFIGLVLPFLVAVYTIGFFADITGWLET